MNFKSKLKKFISSLEINKPILGMLVRVKVFHLFDLVCCFETFLSALSDSERVNYEYTLGDALSCDKINLCNLFPSVIIETGG